MDDVVRAVLGQIGASPMLGTFTGFEREEHILGMVEAGKVPSFCGPKPEWVPVLR